MADEAGRQFDQRFVVLSSPLGADPDLPVTLEPSQGSLDIPARLAEPEPCSARRFASCGSILRLRS